MTEQTTPRKGTILVVDDEEIMREILEALLGREGYDVRLAATGLDGLQLARRTSFDLDWRLYGSPAPETCRLLQRAYPCLKIILLSVNAQDAAAAKEAGAAFIYKGASPDELIATLTPLLRMENGEDAK